MTILSRRGFVGGLIGLVAAPAIVRASSLMPVRSLKTVVHTAPVVGNWITWDEFSRLRGVGLIDPERQYDRNYLETIGRLNTSLLDERVLYDSINEILADIRGVA